METVSSTAIAQLAECLRELTEFLDPDAGWYGEFLRRDPDGMRACLDGVAMPPWDVMESLLQDLAALRGPEFAAERSGRAARLRRAAVLAYDRMPGGEEELHALLAASSAQRAASEAAVYVLSARLSAMPDPAAAAALSRELAWTRDDLTRATSRCSDLAARLAAVPRAWAEPGPGWSREGGAAGAVPSASAAGAEPEREGEGERERSVPASAPAGHGAGPGRPVTPGGVEAEFWLGEGAVWLPGRAGSGSGAGDAAGAELRAAASAGQGQGQGQGQGSAVDPGGAEGVVRPPGRAGSGGAGRRPRKSGGARFAGAAEADSTAAVAAPPGLTDTPEPTAAPRGARFGPPAATGRRGPRTAGTGAGAGAGAGTGPADGARDRAPAPPDVPTVRRAHLWGVPGPATPDAAPALVPAPAPEYPRDPGHGAAAVAPGAGDPGWAAPTAVSGTEVAGWPAARPSGAHTRWPEPPGADPGPARPGPAPGTAEAGWDVPGAAPGPVPAATAWPAPGPAGVEPGASPARLPWAESAAGGAGTGGGGAGTPVLVGELIGLRGQGRTGEAHALLCEAAGWDAGLLPGLARELERAGLAADWAALLWEAASLPPDRLAALAAALGDAGRPADCDRLLRQGAARPASEIADAALALGAAGRAREADALLAAFVRVRTAEEAAGLARRDPRWFAPRLLKAARELSGSAHRDLVHAFRVAGIATTR
ncbi:hypothetical protein ABT084_23825 [Streptomyces sp. NPDC002138]|uniref:hypothetical protein n=1 Tax=Streptomyces sp. NPDC002138 TaxID=3154410 RepID=UPI00331DBB85